VARVPPGARLEGGYGVLGVRRVMMMVVLFGLCLLIRRTMTRNRYGAIGKSGGQHVEKAMAMDC
jgi:hypothetical protein